MVLHLRNETDGTFSATRVAVRHAPDDVRTWERVLGCEMLANATSNSVVIPRTSWQLSLRRCDPALRQVLEARAQDVLGRLPTRHGLVLDVQRALMSRVMRGELYANILARDLEVAERRLTEITTRANATLGQFEGKRRQR